jgi:hypothetical protein
VDVLTPAFVFPSFAGHAQIIKKSKALLGMQDEEIDFIPINEGARLACLIKNSSSFDMFEIYRIRTYCRIYGANSK